MIKLTDLFTSEELTHFQDFKLSFLQLVSQLERTARFAAIFPTTFTINGESYNFPDKKTADNEIDALQKEYSDLTTQNRKSKLCFITKT
jgi:hypothetical protein